MTAVENRLATFQRHCQERGLAPTPQRLAIYQVLAGDDSHPTAEEVFRRLKPQLLSLSLGTVYRTLDLFESHGLVSRIQSGGNQARFDANQDQHSHLVCQRCRRVVDIQPPRFRPPPVPRKQLGGFRVISHRLDFVGVCAACQAEG